MTCTWRGGEREGAARGKEENVVAKSKHVFRVFTLRRQGGGAFHYAPTPPTHAEEGFGTVLRVLRSHHAWHGVELARRDDRTTVEKKWT